MKRKHEKIDILNMYANGNHKKWNSFLSDCLARKDVRKLVQVQYGLEAGMTDLASQKLNDNKISTWFIRVQRSIEITLKRIWREEQKNPLYNPANKHLIKSNLEDKRQKDHDFELFLKRNRF